jgi:DNA-binding MarR family transcriptional regulator
VHKGNPGPAFFYTLYFSILAEQSIFNCRDSNYTFCLKYVAMQPNQQNLPIGYWIKKADNLLTHCIDQIHQDADLTRVGWQLLHTVNKHHQISAAELTTILNPFAGKSEVDTLLANFTDRNLLYIEDSSDKLISLSTKGKQFFEDCLQKQQKIRHKAMEGINEEDYRTTLLTLQQMVSNLE